MGDRNMDCRRKMLVDFCSPNLTLTFELGSGCWTQFVVSLYGTFVPSWIKIPTWIAEIWIGQEKVDEDNPRNWFPISRDLPSRPSLQMRMTSSREIFDDLNTSTFVKNLSFVEVFWHFIFSDPRRWTEKPTKPLQHLKIEEDYKLSTWYQLPAEDVLRAVCGVHYADKCGCESLKSCVFISKHWQIATGRYI